MSNSIPYGGCDITNGKLKRYRTKLIVSQSRFISLSQYNSIKLIKKENKITRCRSNLCNTINYIDGAD